MCSRRQPVLQSHQNSGLVILSLSFQYEVPNIVTVSSGLRHRGLGATPKSLRKTYRRSYKSNCTNNLDCRRLNNRARRRSQWHRRLGSIPPVLIRRQCESQQLRLCRTIRAFGAYPLILLPQLKTKGEDGLMPNYYSSHAKAASTE